MDVITYRAWYIQIASLEQQMNPTLKLAQSVAARRSPKDRPIKLAEVPIIEDSIHWTPKKDVRNTELSERLEHMRLLNSSASGHDNIVTVT